MKRSQAALAAFTLIVTLAVSTASAQPILFSFAALPGAVDTCKWFDDNISDRSVDALTRQTDLLFNRVALPAGNEVRVGGSAVTGQGQQLIDFALGSRTVCTDSEAIYGPTPQPSAAPTPLPT